MVVIGGGNTAIDVAREAVRLGAETVTLVYRRTRHEMPAYAYEVEEAEAEGVTFCWLASPVRFVGSGRLEGVECIRMALGEPGRERTPPAASRSLAASRAARRHGGEGHRPAAAVRAPRVGRRARARARHREDRYRDRRARRIRSSSPAATWRTAARASSRRSRKPSAQHAQSTSGSDARADRDPLARARRPGREDRCPGARARRARGGQERAGVPRVRPRAARRAAARVHALSTISRFAATTASRTRTWSSCSSRRSCARRP